MLELEVTSSRSHLVIDNTNAKPFIIGSVCETSWRRELLFFRLSTQASHFFLWLSFWYFGIVRGLLFANRRKHIRTVGVLSAAKSPDSRAIQLFGGVRAAKPIAVATERSRGRLRARGFMAYLKSICTPTSRASILVKEGGGGVLIRILVLEFGVSSSFSFHQEVSFFGWIMDGDQPASLCRKDTYGGGFMVSVWRDDWSGAGLALCKES